MRFRKGFKVGWIGSRGYQYKVMRFLTVIYAEGQRYDVLHTDLTGMTPEEVRKYRWKASDVQRPGNISHLMIEAYLCRELGWRDAA